MEVQLVQISLNILCYLYSHVQKELWEHGLGGLGLRGMGLKENSTATEHFDACPFPQIYNPAQFSLISCVDNFIVVNIFHLSVFFFF